jgi:predicted nucleotidyltransferase
MKAPRKIKLRIVEIESAFDSLADSARDGFDDAPGISFLDLTTGEVRTPEDEDEADACFGDENILQLPDDLFVDMQRELLDRFVATLPEDATRGRLARAIEGKGAFRRFRDIVFGDGNVELKHRWLWFETRQKRERIVEWLRDENIDPEWDRDIFTEPPLPDKRADLLHAVRDFVKQASALPGVRRIAMLGSLATPKAIPKDVDLLVEVDDGMPLAPLAKLTRRLSGKTMATGDGCGADVFLCNPRHEYLGRVCQSKQCARHAPVLPGHALRPPGIP